jgi:hypothetical protein
MFISQIDQLFVQFKTSPAYWTATAATAVTAAYGFMTPMPSFHCQAEGWRRKDDSSNCKKSHFGNSCC